MDEFIPSLVQSQQITRRIIEVFSYDDIPSGEVRGELLVVSVTESLFRDLSRLQIDLPQDFQKPSMEFSFLRPRRIVNR